MTSVLDRQALACRLTDVDGELNGTPMTSTGVGLRADISGEADDFWVLGCLARLLIVILLIALEYHSLIVIP